MDALLGRLKSFDAYPKTLDDVRVKTYAGAAGACASATRPTRAPLIDRVGSSVVVGGAGARVCGVCMWMRGQ
jgi:hypothetical protein